jgi:hypothetical protein
MALLAMLATARFKAEGKDVAPQAFSTAVASGERGVGMVLRAG